MPVFEFSFLRNLYHQVKGDISDLFWSNLNLLYQTLIMQTDRSITPNPTKKLGHL